MERYAACALSPFSMNDTDGRFIMTRADDITDASRPHELRCRPDGTVDTDFYRRCAAEQRSAELGRLLLVAARAVRRWAVAVPTLARRGGQTLLMESRDGGAPLAKVRGNSRRA
jgi:hypothetical protein